MFRQPFDENGVVQFALPPIMATPLQPAIVLPSATKSTVPFGVFPAIVALMVTLCPGIAGFSEVVNIGLGA